MRKKSHNFLTGFLYVTGMMSVLATGASVATVPAGMITYTLARGTTSYLSFPLTNNESYTGSVAAVTTNTISVGDSPAPFTTSLATPASPYFVKFLSGSQTGRVLLVSSNTSSALTLDTTDHGTGVPVLLTTAGFSVEVGDTFEIFPGDTLSSVFGAGTAGSPLILTGGANVIMSDSVCLFTSVNAPATCYYFNTTADCWEKYGATGNANNTIIYPYSAFAVTRQINHPNTTFIVSGRVTPVGAETKVESLGTVFTSTHYAIDVKLSQLQFGSNWTMGSSVSSADTLSVWNASVGHFDTYYQVPDSTWRKYPDAVTDQSNFAITAGTVTTIGKRDTVSGAATFVQSALPYSLD